MLGLNRKKKQAIEEARERAEYMQLLADVRAQVEQERAERENAARWIPRPGEIVSRLRSLLWRSRDGLRPLVVLSVLHILGALVSRETVSHLLSLVVSLVVALAVWRVRYRRLSRESERQYAVVLLAAAVLWLDWTALSGVIGETDFALWFVGSLAAVPWWVHHWPRERPGLPDVAAADDIVTRWTQNLAAPGRQLAGAGMTGEVDATEHYDAYTVELVPGVQSYAAVMQKLPLVESGLRTPLEQLHLEHPHPRYRRDPAMVELRVLREAPSGAIEWFTKPRFHGGKVILGDHTDKDGQAAWRVFTQNRMWGGFMAGGTGIGKTRLLEIIGLTMRQQFVEAAVPTALIYLDGQNGASSPTLYKHATWSGGVAESEAMLDSIENAMEVRQAFNRHHGLTGFTPGLVLPGEEEALTALLVIVDECHKIWHNRTLAKRWSSVAREAGKLGIGVVGASQATDLEVFAGLEILRSSLLEGNGVAMRITSKTQGNLIPGLHIDPADLPAIPGFGVTIAAPGSDQRTAPFRAPFAPAQKDMDQGVLVPDGVTLLDAWYEVTRDAPVDKLTAHGLGARFATRNDIADLEREATAKFLEQIRRGEQVREDRERIVVDTPAPAKKAGVKETVLAMCERSDTPISRKQMIEETGATAEGVRQAIIRLGAAVVRVGDGLYTTAAKAAALSESKA